MAIFAIIKQPGPNGERLENAIHAAFPSTVYNLSASSWLVAASGTAKDVSDKIGITGGESGSAIVTETASYYGRANPAIWTWIKTNWEGPPIG